MAPKEQSNHDNNQVVTVMVPFPAQGHLNQLLHLSRLISSHNIPVHYVGTTTHNRQATLRVQGWDPNSASNIHFHSFQVPPYPSPPPNPTTPQNTRFPIHMIPSFQASSHLRDPVATLLRSLASDAKRIVVIHDSIIASVVRDAADIPKVDTDTFQSVPAFTLFLYLWGELGGYPDLGGFHVPEAPSLEGCLTDEFMDFVNAQYEFIHKLSDGNIYNTSRAVEGPYLDLIERLTGSPNQWALGPFNPLSVEKKGLSDERHLSIEWLDKQEPNSVIYVSFGTTTTFTEEEMERNATGLERSGRKFVWVVRDADNGNIFDKGEDSERRDKLPGGFEERVEGVGLVVRDWALQLEILSYRSVGRFMSHCGWNSSMESMSMGVGCRWRCGLCTPTSLGTRFW